MKIDNMTQVTIVPINYSNFIKSESSAKRIDNIDTYI